VQPATFQVAQHLIADRTLEIERRREVAEGLQELLAIVNSGDSLQEILEFLATQSRRLLRSDASAIFTPIEEAGVELHRIRASDGLTPELVAVRLPFGRPATGLAYERRCAVIVSDMSTALSTERGPTESMHLNEQPNRIDVLALPALRDGPETQLSPKDAAVLRSFSDQFNAFVAVPLTLEDAIYGTLTLYYCQPRTFNDDDIALASTFARQAALSIENARLRERTRYAATIDERQRLARELHDAVTQTLFSASLISEVIPDLWESNPAEARRRLQQLGRLTRGALAEMRLLLVELRPNALTEMPIAELLRQLIDASSGAMQAELSLDVASHYRTALTPDAQIAFYRIAQEALNNIAKHADAKHVHLSLACHDTSIQMTISDDGRGFETAAIPAGHLGIGIMTERAEAVQADIDVASSPGTGTTIRVTWPKRDVPPSDVSDPRKPSAPES
jgi:signal transduction histidine kinase